MFNILIYFLSLWSTVKIGMDILVYTCDRCVQSCIYMHTHPLTEIWVLQFTAYLLVCHCLAMGKFLNKNCKFFCLRIELKYLTTNQKVIDTVSFSTVIFRCIYQLQGLN